MNTSSIRNRVIILAGFDSVMANRTQRSARQLQNLLTPHLNPEFLVQPHSSLGEHLSCEMEVAFNCTAFSVSVISVFDECQNTCLACAHIYVGFDTVPMNIPQKCTLYKCSQTVVVALNCTTFSVSEISVFDVCLNTCLACAHIYVG